MSNVIPLKRVTSRTFTAKQFRVRLAGDVSKSIIISGTLDGFIDFVVPANTGTRTLTNAITLDEARELAAKLLLAVEDIRQNCLYDRDALLLPED